MKPLAIDLYCGLGGWTEGLLAEGYRVVGFDIERHVYGEHRYPAQLVIQDVLTLHGSQFKTAALIVASPPCQAYSYRAMPWKRAKALPPPDNSLFEACFRIQREASEAAGHHIPLVVENVRGAQKWVGRARWHFGSFYLWGDVPALMPMVKAKAKVGGINFNGYGTPGYKGQAFNTTAEQRLREEVKTPGRNLSKGTARKFGTHNMGSAAEIAKELGINQRDFEPYSQHGVTDTRGRFIDPASPAALVTENDVIERVSFGSGVQGSTAMDYRGNADSGQQHARSIKNGGDWFGSGADCSLQRRHSSKSNARKAASAMIAKIPFVLSQHIARVYKPEAAA